MIKGLGKGKEMYYLFEKILTTGQFAHGFLDHNPCSQDSCDTL